MNGETKAMCLIGGFFFLMVVCITAFDNYSDAEIAKSAMENGYEQVQENGKVLWKKQD